MLDTFIEAPALAVLIFFSLVMPVMVWADAKALSEEEDDD